MKTIIITTCLIFLTLFSEINAQLKVDNTGDVQMLYNNWTGGLKVSYKDWLGFNFATLHPNEPWYGALGTYNYEFGAAYISHIYYWNSTNYSDKRLKKDINDMNNSLAKILALKPVNYKFKDDFLKDMPDNIKKDGAGTKYGFLAQDVQKVIPELIFEEPQSKYLTINIEGIVPFLVGAIKEQQALIEDLKSELSVVKNNDKDGKAKSAIKSSNNVLANKLFQNNPNPFSERTKINMYIHEDATTATLYIYDMQGTQQKSISVKGKGTTSVTISAGDFNAGMYMYTLIVDGKEIDTKKMILTK